MNKNRLQIILGIIALAFVFGCCPQIPSKPDMTVYPSDSDYWHKEEWGGHVYVIWKESLHMGGITHDPDCPFCKEAKVEEN